MDLAKLQAEVDAIAAQIDTAKANLSERRKPFDDFADQLRARRDEIQAEIDEINERLYQSESQVLLAPWRQAAQSEIYDLERRLSEATRQRDLAELASGSATSVRIIRDYWASNGVRLRSGRVVKLPAGEARKIIRKGIAALA